MVNETASTGKWEDELTLMPVLYVAGDSRKQQDLHSFSLYLGGQAQVPSH